MQLWGTGTLQAFAVNAVPSCLLGQIRLIFLFVFTKTYICGKALGFELICWPWQVYVRKEAA